MKLLSCFTRSRDQMMWSCSAWIWAAASAADSGYITVVHPNPVHRQDMILLSTKHSRHEGRKNNFKPPYTRNSTCWKKFMRDGKLRKSWTTNCRCSVSKGMAWIWYCSRGKYHLNTKSVILILYCPLLEAFWYHYFPVQVNSMQSFAIHYKFTTTLWLQVESYVYTLYVHWWMFRNTDDSCFIFCHTKASFSCHLLFFC